MKPLHLDPPQRQELQRRRHQTRDKRLYERLSAVLWIADGKTRFEVADLLGCSVRQLAEWLRRFRNRGLDALCTLHQRGDPGNLSAAQVERLKQEISTGRFRNSDQIRHWVEEVFGVSYTPSGIKDLLRRVGASYHKVTGFLWKADPDRQQQFVKKYRRQRRAARRPGSRRTRCYFVDACHPIWGLDLVFSCWLLVGQRFLVGMGSGRKRLNILGAYCPDDREYLDLRLTRDNINGEQFVNLLRLLRATHLETERFVLYLDRAKYYGSPVVKAWLSRHREFQLEPLPTYSPNLNLIERLWKFLRKRALSRWHKTFEAMQAAVSEVLDHLSDYRSELDALMTENFHIVAKEAIPVEYREVA
jgi:transposase